MGGAGNGTGAIFPSGAPEVHLPSSGPPPSTQPQDEAAGTQPTWSSEVDGVLTDPIDPRYLTEVPFGTSSFWIQPWRAYLDTWPASRLLESLGINFNVMPAQAEATAQLLQESGFKLARREIGWGGLSYQDPSTFRNEAQIDTVLEALHKHGLRPLILLNANSGAPAPAQQITLETVAAAPEGAQTVTLSQASATEVVPGKTGFDGLSFGGDPDILITSMGPGDIATLSRPLLSSLPAGPHKGTTLLYAPFGAPTLPDGEPNPTFQETLAGWLSYVATVCRKAASIFGPEGYDLEVWNELSFGSQFLDSEHYYPSSSGDAGAEGDAGSGGTDIKTVTNEVTKAVLEATVAYVRNPANGIPSGVGITDGFASETPFPSGAQAPPGLTALSKHPYVGFRSFPADEGEENIIPINALGQRDTTQGSYAPLFVPSYDSLFPEYTLTATSTETLIRDLAPFTTYIYGDPHGREVGPPGGQPAQKWITEYNLSTNGATPVGPDGVTPEAVTLTKSDKEHFEAKALLRSLVAMISKGISREYFFAAAPGDLSLISPSFFQALEAHPGEYPGEPLGGETMTGFRNMLAQFQGPGPNGTARQLELLAIAQDGDHTQFSGDGTEAHPTLYDRDVLAVFPFQTSPTRFVIPVYVMTRDLLTLYQPYAPSTDIRRFDMPNETFRITLGNLPSTEAQPIVSAYDPLTNESTPAQLISRSGNQATIEIAATDYPRLLILEFTGQ